MSSQVIPLPTNVSYQGRIELPKAARGHATSNSANLDSKNRELCAACRTTHTVEVLTFYTLSLSTSTHVGMGGPTRKVMQRIKNLKSKFSNIQHYAVYMCCMPSRRLWRLDAPLLIYASWVCPLLL